MSNAITRRTLNRWLSTLPILPLFSLKTAVAAANSQQWAVGGTDLIRTKYPDTAIFQQGSACSLQPTPATTRGPCWFADDTGEDIALGLEGLPMQLCLRLIDRNCQPLANHLVEVWHCDTRGVYSGDTSQSSNASRFYRFCTGGDSTAKNSSWYRGQLHTNADGRVNFKSCFPGWYPGRTIHIHFAVSDPAGRSRIVSQFCFTDELCADICTTHPHYRDRGIQDRPLASGRDGVFPSQGYEPFVMSTERNIDGTLLAYHSIQLG